MELQLFYTSSDKLELNKKLTALVTLENVHSVEPFDVSAPTLKLGSVTSENLKNCNYAYIPEYKRYYYVEPPVITNNGVVYLRLDVDCYMSFKSGILALTCIIDKAGQEGKYNPDYDDGSYINQEGIFITTKHYQAGFPETPSNILIVAGG